MAAALIRLLVLENIFLIPSQDIYLLVGAYIKYRVAKMVQGRMTGKLILLFLRLTFPKSFLLTREAASHYICKILLSVLDFCDKSTVAPQTTRV